MFSHDLCLLSLFIIVYYAMKRMLRELVVLEIALDWFLSPNAFPLWPLHQKYHEQIAASFGFWPRNLTAVPKPVLSKKPRSVIYCSCSFPVLNGLSWVVMGWIADRPGLK